MAELVEGQNESVEVVEVVEQNQGADQQEADGTKTFSETYVKQLRGEAANYRRELREAQEKLREIDDSQKSEAQKLLERAESAEVAATTAALEASRLKVALDKGLTADQAKRLVGSTEEELAADADVLLSLFASGSSGDRGLDPTPRERLKPGAVPNAEVEETDPAKLAAKVPRPYQ